MRKIKFRAWNKYNNCWRYFTLKELAESIGLNEDIDISTFQQFTGLKDKNGKEIYEGDIMRDKTSPNRELVWVYWNESECRWGLHDNRKSGEYSFTYKNWEIIGNTYENEDLLTSVK